jgi:transketolase
MNQPVIFVFTHDSFYVGEDGPTHEPIEQVEALRVIPRLKTIRPADPNETAWAWLEALRNTQAPTALVLTRQKLPTLPGTSLEGFKRGGYIIKEATGQPDLVILASGSEVSLAVSAAELLAAKGRNVRVVSVPCRETLLEQKEDYIQDLLGEGALRVAIEAGIGSGWYRLVGPLGLVISMKDFGESAPAEVLASEFGFTPEKVADKIETYLKKK